MHYNVHHEYLYDALYIKASSEVLHITFAYYYYWN